MKRRTHLFLVAIDEDPIPGAMDKDRIVEDVSSSMERNFGYNVKTHHLGSTTRASNFTKQALLELDVNITIFGTDNIICRETLDILYEAEQPRPE